MARSDADKWTCTDVRPLHYAQCIAPWKSWPSSRARNLADCAKLSARIGKSRVAFERTEPGIGITMKRLRRHRRHMRAPSKDSGRERRREKLPAEERRSLHPRVSRSFQPRRRHSAIHIGGERRVHAHTFYRFAFQS